MAAGGLRRVAIAAALVAWAPAASAGPYEGFGADTRGGDGERVVRVTTLADAGPGSLRDALAAGSRTIVFDVAGEIVLKTHLWVQGPYVTVDGFSAPAPGITLRGYGLVIRGTRGARDVIVRGLRVRDAAIDGIQVSGGASNVVLDHVSVDHSADGNIDITTESRDVTVSWSILSGTTKNMLIKYDPARVTLHHNLFVGNGSRNPQARIDDDGGRARQTTLDMRNNVVAGWVGYGTLVWEGAWANVVANYYGRSKNAVTVEHARAWVADNVSGDGGAVDRAGTEAAPFPAPPVATTDACTAATGVLADAGVRPLDARDGAAVAGVSLAGCPATGPVVARPPDPVPPVAALAPAAAQSPLVAVDAVPPAIPPPPADGAITAEFAVASAADDGNEYDGRRVYATRSLLAVGGRTLLGLRFAGVTVPRGAQVLSAILEVVPAGNTARPIHLFYLGEAAGDSPPLDTSDGALSARPKTRAFVDDVPAPWRRGEVAASPDLAAVIQEIVDHPGWMSGNGLTLFVGSDGSGGERLVAAYESKPSPGLAARLVITYR